MKKFFLGFWFFCSMFALANESTVTPPKPPLSFSLPLLKSIENKAINFGSGPVDVYVFIDPMCPRSREFVQLIDENSKMQALYSYHFFLYELKRFKSKQIIEAIYANQDHKEALRSVMINHKEMKLSKLTNETKNTISKIAHIASKIGVYKRPYLILVKKGKE